MVGKTVSHYKIIERLGGGGMGVVYKAQDLKLDRYVALKFLPPELTGDPEAKKRFVHEAKAASALQHNNICTIHDIDETADGQMFIVMDLYEGETLKQKVEQGPLRIHEALDIAKQVAQGLGEAHKHGIVHRDIKPANILLTKGGVAKIVDFGLAKLTGRTLLTMTGTTLGTVAYMSPEQARGESADQRTDIWSLGVVLYEMLTGQRPFKGSFEQAVVYSLLNQAPEPVTGLRTGIPVELDRIICKCMEKDASARYQHIDEVLVDLNALQRTEPVSVASTPSIDKAAQTRGRRRSLPWMAGVLLLIIGIVVTYLYLSGRKEKGSAVKAMIVVLPFENLGSAEDEYFADGMTEEITSRLSSVRGLGVISRTSAVQYKHTRKSIRQIGEELGVSHVLEGTVRWERESDGASHVRVTPQLIRVEDDIHLWSDRFDREMNRIFEVQADIAKGVIRQLGIALLGGETASLEARPTPNPEAYQAYLRGVDAMAQLGYKQQDYQRAVGMFRRAVELDPKFALAFAELSKAYLSLYHFTEEKSRERDLQAKQAVERALELDPDLARAHFVLGYYHYWVQGDYQEALKEFAIAEKGLPNESDLLASRAYIWRRQGRFTEALENQKRAFELNPRSAELAYQLSITCTCMRTFAEADEYARQAASIAPDFLLAFLQKSWITWLWKGDALSARQVLDEIPVQNDPYVSFFRGVYELYGGKNEEALSHFFSFSDEVFADDEHYYPRALLLGLAYESMGQRDSAYTWYDNARTLLERDLRIEGDGKQRIHAALGWVYALLGRKDEALYHGNRAVELCPITRDRLDGGGPILHLALVYVRLGDLDAAMDRIEYLLSVPSQLISVATLRASPDWKPLQKHPRYQSVLEKYAKHER